MQVEAEFNHGRWIWRCPKCNGAELAAIGVLGSGVCYSCHPCTLRDPRSVVKAWKDAEKAGEVYEIILPEEADEIEAILSVRPVKNKNWLPGERPEKLREENAGHGLKSDMRSAAKSVSRVEDESPAEIVKNGGKWAVKPDFSKLKEEG